MNAQHSLPIQRLTLYKHGVGFVERRGDVTGAEVALVFRADEVNDALKSLLVVDYLGGQVLGIGYDTPPAGQSRPSDSPITLSDDHSLLDLLRGLRGWTVRLVTSGRAPDEGLSGRLLGVDVDESETSVRRTVVSLLDEARGAVLAVPLDSVRQVVLLEERAAQNLRFFLDSRRGEDAQRTVVVRLSEGAHDLAVSYLVPSPTWRVSYRLVVEAAPSGDTSGEGAEEQGTLLLQGWGLFDNGLEEDLEDVMVTLVAGQPISFIYNLAASRIPDRPVVEDAARVATAPVEFEGAYAMAAQVAPAPAPPGAFLREGAAIPAMARRAPHAMSIEDVSRQAAAAAGGELGELFQYTVTAPVTVKRGASALVPILSAMLPYRRELLFNQRKLPDHPVVALRFDNETGLVLERGPVTVLAEGAYHGEALVPFTKEGREVYLAYAVELGIKVSVSTATSTNTAGIRIAGALLEEKQAMVLRTTYRVENALATAQRVTIEHSIWGDAELVETPAPDARTSEFYRWAVNCRGHGVTEFVAAERRYTWQSSYLLDQSYATLQQYLSMNWLDARTLERIRALLDHKAAIARNEAEMERLQEEREEIYGREEQLRKNMAALGTGGDEATLRAQAVAQLGASEARLNAIDARITALKEDNERRQGAIDAELAAIAVPEAAQG